MASQLVDDTIVTLAATGLMSPSQLASAFGYTPGGMAQALKRLAPRIEMTRQTHLARVLSTMSNLMDALPSAGNTMTSAIRRENPDDRACIDSSRWLLETMLLKSRAPADGQPPAMTPELTDELAETLRALRHSKLLEPAAYDVTQDPHVSMGRPVGPVSTSTPGPFPGPTRVEVQVTPRVSAVIEPDAPTEPGDPTASIAMG